MYYQIIHKSSKFQCFYWFINLILFRFIWNPFGSVNLIHYIGCSFPVYILVLVFQNFSTYSCFIQKSCLLLSFLVLASGFCVTVHSVCMYSRKPVLDQCSGHIYLEKLLCKFQKNVNSYMFWTFCIEEWLEVRLHLMG